LNQRGGAERVFAHVAAAWPDAPVYTALYDAAACGDLVAAARVRTSFLQRIPGGRRAFRALAPFYPRAFESFDLSAYDVVVSSTTSWAKGVITRPDAVHVCYINTVSRFAFDYDRYVGGFGVGVLARPLVERLIAWDKLAARRPTLLVANSRNVARRVQTFYGREALVLPCPVDVDRYTLGRGAGESFVIVSRLLPYKAIDRAIVACAQAGVPLEVIGTGPAEAALKALARGTRTTFHGYLDDAAVNRIVGNARAAIVPGEEDFGLLPLEAAAAGPRSRSRAAEHSKRSSPARPARSSRIPRRSRSPPPYGLSSRAPTTRGGCARTRRPLPPGDSSSACAPSSPRLLRDAARVRW
jgi:glycosyltransferase involved in cell wall biosynthesis